MRIFIKRLCGAYAVAAWAAAALAAAIVLRYAPGPDAEVARDPYWGVVKWYVLDAHAVLGFSGVAAGAVWALLRAYERLRRLSTPAQRRWKVALPYALGLLLVYGAVKFTIEEHPVAVHSVRVTSYPASKEPDQIVLTPGADPSEAMAVQWRTSTQIDAGAARYRPAGSAAAQDWQLSPAASRPLEDRYLVNDPVVMLHSATLEGLEPATRYEYQVGGGDRWSRVFTFETAPGGAEPYSFMYLGDAQTGLADWGALLQDAYARHPDVAFILIAGDLVNDGGQREQWDLFFEAGEGVFSERPLVPAIGNHDDDDWGDPWMYLRYFDLPDNGPAEVGERAYAFTYGPSQFVVLDTNLPVETQTAWLAEQLAGARAPWLFTVLHHPVYASKPARDNVEVRKAWAPLFDEFGVAIAFQGHDHAYMRTYPMREDERAGEGGTVYLVTVSGDKYYEQDAPDFAAKAVTNRSTYQVVDVSPGAVRYRAFTAEGGLLDSFTLHEPIRSAAVPAAEGRALTR